MVRLAGDPVKRTLSTLVMLWMFLNIAHAQLAVTYGSKGIQTISYNGTTLEDVGAYPNDAFHVWHFYSADSSGNTNCSACTGWGEVNNGESWNGSTNTETYTYGWGTLAVQFAVSGNNLNQIITFTNNANSGVIVAGGEIYPYALHFPSDPSGFYGYSQWKPTISGPGLSVADYGSGVATVVATNAAIHTYTGWKQVAGQNSESGAIYSPIMATTLPDGATNFPALSMNLQPGTSATYTVSVRFTNEGTQANVADAASNYAATYPYQVSWSNHSPISTAYLATSTSGANLADNNASNPAGCGASSANPRNYTIAGNVNCSTSLLSTSYQDVILQRARDTVTATKQFGGQAVITWDMEGEEYSQPVTYVCSPDQIATISPEMEQPVTTSTSANSAYVGMKLDDAYIAILKAGGLGVGFCLRPNHYIQETSSTADPNNSTVTLPAGSAVQVFPTSTGQAISWLEAKIAYVQNRWGTQAKYFYIDSMVDANGMPLSPDVLKQVTTDYPGVLLMPEAQNGGSPPTSTSTTTASIGIPLRYYAYSAPFDSFIFHSDIGTPAQLPGSSLYTFYPNAFSTILINDANSQAITNFTSQLTNAVSHGDILLGHGDYDDEPNNTDIANINTAAAYQAPTTACGGPAGTNCWYIRSDGGTRYSTNATSGQCNGLADAAYPGSGTNQPCAFNDFRFLYDDQSYGNNAWVVNGGDTVIVRSCASPDGSPGCRIGFNQGASGGDPWCVGGGGATGCVSPPVPSGASSSNPTRILGANYAQGASGTKIILHGGWDVYQVFSLRGSSNVQIESFEIYGQSSCRTTGDAAVSGDPAAAGLCPNSYPYNDNLQTGIWTDQNTGANGPILLQDLYIHRVTSRGVQGPIGGTINANRVHIGWTGQSGWDFDDGSQTHSVNGVWNFTNGLIEWAGAMEEYPDVHNVPTLLQFDDAHGTVADCVGTPDTPLVANLSYSTFRYCSQDGPDLGHIDGLGGQPTSVVYDHVISYGNEGQQLKWGGVTTTALTNSIIVGNCTRLATQVGDEPDPKTHLGDFCRASGDALSFNNIPGTGNYTDIENNTMVNDTSEFMLWGCWNNQQTNTPACPPTTSGQLSLVLRNNIFMGFLDPVWASGYTNGNPPNLLSTQTGASTAYMTEDHNVFYGLKNNYCGTGTGDICADPKLAGGSTFTSRAMFDNFALTLGTGSPAIHAATAISGITTDFTGAALESPPSIGALNSTSSATTTSTPASGNATPSASAPTASPAAGTYTTTQSVTLLTITPSATIYYTLDGSTPTTSSPVYSSAIPISTTTTIRAFVSATNYTNSSTSTFTYTITPVATGTKPQGLKGLKGCHAPCHI